MAKIDDLIRGLEQLLTGADQSNTPHARGLAETYAEVCRDVNASLAECRTMFRMGAYAEARKLNSRANPTLVDRYRILNFSRRQDLIRLCMLYGWSVPPELDSETVALLENKEDEKREITITELQDQWRRIIRDGSLREKLILARKIYALDQSGVWRSNLLNVERPWVNALKKAADEALAEERAEDLLEIYQELISPDLIQRVPESELIKYQELVSRRNREQVEEQKKNLLDEIAGCYAAMLLPELEAALGRWNALESNPLFSITPEEKIQISDARTFLLEQQAEMTRKEQFRTMQNQLEQMLNDEADPKEIDRVYHSLQQLDLPIKPLLEERMRDLYARMELEAKRRHVRRCLYWGISAFLLAGLVFTGIILFQRERDFQLDSEEIRARIDSGQYESALEYCQQIKQERPSIAARPAIEALRKEAEDKLAEQLKIRETFEQACVDLEERYLTEENVFAPGIEKLFAELEERAKVLPEKQKKLLLDLRQKYEDLKEEVYTKYENEFYAKIIEIQKQWNSLKDEFEQLSDDQITTRFQQLKQDTIAVLNQYKPLIRKQYHEQWSGNYNGYVMAIEDKIKSRAEFRERTKHLNYPESLEDYAQALRELDEPGRHTEAVRSAFAKAIKPASVAKFLPYKSESSLVPLLDQYQSDPFCRDVKAKVTHPDRKAEWLHKRGERLSNLEDVVLKQYELFEVLLKGTGKTYCFYLKNPGEDLLLEQSWDGKTTKAVRFDFVQNDKAFKKYIVLQPDNSLTAGEIATFSVPAGQKFGEISGKLELKDPSPLLDTRKLERAPHYNVLNAGLAKLKGDTTVCSVLKLIIDVLDDRTINNVYAKVHLLTQLYSLLPVEEQPVYAERLKNLDTLLRKYSDVAWQDPVAVSQKGHTLEAFHQEVRDSGVKEQIAGIILSELLREEMVKHYPIAVGVLYRNKGKWKIHTFSDKDAYGTRPMFLFGGPEDKKVCLAFPTSQFADWVGADKIPAALKDNLYHGQLVYVNDGIAESWAAVFRKVVQKFNTFGFELPSEKDIIWPESWPTNCRNLKELNTK